MIRNVIIYVLLLALPTGLSGQRTWNAGLKAGASLATQTVLFELPDQGDYKMETGGIAGPTASLFVETGKGGRWGTQLDISYIPKGSSTTTESITVHHLEDNRITENKGEKSTSRFHYLSMAPQVRFRILKGGVTPYLMVGPRVDFLLNYSTDSSYPLEDQNKVIAGLNLGAGVDANLTGLALFAECIFQGDAFPVTGADPMLINNHAFLLTLGLRYPL